MNYLQADNLSKSYGEKILFEGVDLSINKGQKIALVAKNGTGKSTLLKILVDKESADTGTVLIHKDVKTAYLDQSPDFPPHLSVWEAIFETENPTLTIIRNYESALLKQELYPSNTHQAALERAMEEMQVAEAWDYEAKIKQILGRFKIRDLERKVGLLSGGEQKRVALASLLLQEPDFLILDEPTNHLDLDMVEWLEEHLRTKKLTLLLVTHDRYFLNRVTNEIIEIEKGETQRFRGNYEYYLEKKEELVFNFKAEVGKAAKLMRKELDWIRTQPKARGTKAKSRVSAFDKIKEKAYQRVKEDKVSFSDIKMSRIGGKTVELWHIDKSYDEKKILEEFTYVFKRRDRVGIIGPNGSGKTTLLNILTGALKPDRGKVVIGKTLVFGYYTQQGIQLEEDKKVIDVVRDIAEILPLAKGKYLTAGQLLDHFNFPYSVHTKYVSTLSGGERRRLYLLTVLMENPNFLILDEPTNDLDLLTLNVLEEFLSEFNGCLVIVSHDRYFMDKIVDHVFVFEGEGKLRDFPGNYTQYRARRKTEEQAERERLKAEKAKTQTGGKGGLKDPDRYKSRLSYKEKREYEQLEKDIEALEAEKDTLEAQLNAGQQSHEELTKQSRRLGEVVALIDEKSDRWLELSERA